ncbi:MAG: DNA polymerase III subunit delta [Actinomycetales bacterium]|nr:DNA polymerase III subunit delta [Actinomycetales bacterium]
MTIARVTLAMGAETVLVDRAVRSLTAEIRRADPGAQRAVIDAASESAAMELREAVAPNLFGDGGIVIVQGIDGAEESTARAIREACGDLPEGVYLVLTHPGGVKGKALVDAVKQAGADVVDCQTIKKGKATTDFLMKEFSRHRRKVTPDAVAALYDAVGHDLGLLVSAVSQLSSDVEANPITADEVRAYFAGVADVSGFVISDAVWQRQYVDAVRALRQAMLATDSGRVGPATIASLASGLRTLVRVGGMPPGASESDVAREAGVPPWKVAQLRRQWARWSGDQRRLAAAVVSLADADGAMKGGVREGSSLDPGQKLLALELLVARTAGTPAAS